MEINRVFNNEFLASQRVKGDLPADTFIQSAFENAEQKNELRAVLASLTGNSQLIPAYRRYSNEPLFKNASKLPSWADVKQMKEGAEFFAKHAQAIMNLLGLLSLPYCYTAANGAMVLYLSERMKTDVGKRLFETAEFVWDVMSPDAFEQEGSGFASILKIRLMHAAARYYTLKSGKWDSAWGYPVNQEDMAGTNLSFSLMVIRGLRKFGFTITYAGQQAFMHLWNVIGFLLGLEESLLPQNGKEAYNLEEAIRVRQFQPSQHGQELTRSLTQYFISVNKGGQFSNSEILQVIRYLLGNNVADLLDLPPAQLPKNKILLLRTLNYVNGFKPVDKPGMVYRDELYKFKQNKPMFEKG